MLQQLLAIDHCSLKSAATCQPKAGKLPGLQALHKKIASFAIHKGGLTDRQKPKGAEMVVIGYFLCVLRQNT